MSIPNYVTALANHKGNAIVHAGGMILPVKIMDISHEETPTSSETTFKCMIVNQNEISAGVTQAAKQILNSIYGRTAYNDGTTRKASNTYRANPFEISKVIFNAPATIVFWADGTKTVVKCQEGDTYSKETGLATAIAKKALGNKGNFNDVFKKFIPEY